MLHRDLFLEDNYNFRIFDKNCIVLSFAVGILSTSAKKIFSRYKCAAVLIASG